MVLHGNCCRRVIMVVLVSNVTNDGHRETLLGFIKSAVMHIGACRPEQCPGIPGHCLGYFESCILISQGPDAKTHGHQHIASICVHRCMYSTQCSDKIRFLQLRIKCGAAKSCLGTHSALQLVMHGSGRWSCCLHRSMSLV